MEPEIEIIEVEDSGDDHLSLQDSHDSDVSLDDRPIAPSIGSAHQAEIPNLATDDERRHLMASSLYTRKFHVYDDPGYVASAIPVIRGSHPQSEVNKKEDITSECDSPFLDPHDVLPVGQTESASNPVSGEKPVLCFTRKCRSLLTDQTMVHQREKEKTASLPGLSSSVWSDLEEECFLLGLHIFGKDLNLLSKFVGSKTVADMLSYYYGRFYNRDAYKRWSHCRKTRSTRCILGKSIFTGRRQQELISRLKSKLSKESHDSLVEVLKSFSDDLTSLEECVFTLKSTIGLETFVEVIAVGKGKDDLTGFVKDTSKASKGLSGSANMAKGVDCSTLATEDIIKFLTGDFRRSKAKSNDLFWEAVWPRLLARGWHSEQPKDVRTAKNCLVFIVPGIKKFSRKKLTKGTHYFDCTTDVLKKVATDPSLLELEIDSTDNGASAHKNAWTTSQDGPLNDDMELLVFTVIDTSLVQGERPFKVRALRSLPADVDISSGPAQYSDNMSSDSSSQEQYSGDNMSDDQEYHGRESARAKNIEMESVYGTTSLVNLLQSMETAPRSVSPVDGHSSDDQHSDISNSNGDEVDVACFSALGTKAGRRVYLSPKSRRFASSSNVHTSRHSFSFRNADDLERNKLKPLSASLKPTVVDLGGNFQTRTFENFSTKGKPCEEIADVAKSATNGISLNVANINEDKSSEGKFHTVDEASMETSLDNHNCLQKNEGVATSISNSEIVPDVLEAMGKHDLTVQPRHGTRTRAPTARALEAVALGLLGGTKRKGEAGSLTTRRPPQRARKNKD
ncbi:uncharacterized protein [Lolium perenne]|uniref:uncharacterized protein n=1 Tax=Lolium perenne TaxID=4522 RepID=UPI0021F5549F|nr:uncharacterized protein LOC127323195 [Lolium perenne]